MSDEPQGEMHDNGDAAMKVIAHRSSLLARSSKN
jgi:hypothetical protein